MEEYVGYTLEILKKLISIPTVNPPGQDYKRCAEYLGGVLEELGLEVELIEVPEDFMEKYYPYTSLSKGYPRYIVYGRAKRKGRRIIHFNGHYDVVPPGSGWSRDPFTPHIEGDKLFGRGSTDMKGGIAASIAAIRAALEKGLDVGLEAAYVPDEEAGGTGTRYFTYKNVSKPDYVIIAEPSTSSRINIGHKGLVRGVVRVFGKQVHGSVPWKGENAFIRAAKLASEFMDRYAEVLSSRVTKAPVMEPEARHPTINLGGYAESTSRKDNIVPGEFTFSFDRRTIPEEDVEQVAKELVEIFTGIAGRQGVRAEVKILSSVPASLTPLDSSLVRASSECVEKVLGSAPTILMSYGRDDGVFYRSVGIDTITYGPGVEETAHMPDEYTSIEDLKKTIIVYDCMIESLSKT
ncbi:MAG: M20 family metallopeptidase [Zestosphaera sp.]